MKPWLHYPSHTYNPFEEKDRVDDDAIIPFPSWCAAAVTARLPNTLSERAFMFGLLTGWVGEMHILFKEIWGLELDDTARKCMSAFLMVDAHGCSPWINIFKHRRGDIPIPEDPITIQADWIIVQTPHKKRYALHMVNGYIDETFKVRDGATAPALSTHKCTIRAMSNGKCVFDMKDHAPLKIVASLKCQ
jgi:hypothetical protein